MRYIGVGIDFRPFSPIANPGIGGVPIPESGDYKNSLKSHFLSAK